MPTSTVGQWEEDADVRDTGLLCSVYNYGYGLSPSNQKEDLPLGVRFD